MRFKTGMWLLVFVVLLSVGSFIYKIEKTTQSQPQNKTSTVQMSEEKATSKEALGTRGEKVEAAALNQNNDRMNNFVDDSGHAVTGERTTEADANKQTMQAKISITGSGIKGNKEFTLDEFKQMNDITVSANYFSRGAEKPGWAKAAHTDFAGVFLYGLLSDYVGLTAAASRVKIIAQDDYVQVFSIEDIKADYIDETDSGKKLRMIVAWSQDGKEYDASQGSPFRLVMGQQFAGDYNRQKWVDQIARIVVE